MLVYSMTDVGKKRELNEDYIFTSVDLVGGLENLFCVADGMGGHKAGDYASEYTIKKLVETIQSIPASDEISNIISEAINAANAYVYDCSANNIDFQGMGSTLVLATIKNDKAYVANVGDSRLYLIRNKEIKQITRDHSFVEEMVNLGELDREAARNHPDKNIITRAIGVKPYVSADIFEVELQNDDKLLLCSDGLTNMLKDSEIIDIVNDLDTKHAVEQLIQSANERGGRDNIAVVLVEPYGGR